MNDRIINLPENSYDFEYERNRLISLKAVIVYFAFMYIFVSFVQYILSYIAPNVTGQPLYIELEPGKLILQKDNEIFINIWTQIIIYTTLFITLICLVKSLIIKDFKKTMSDIKLYFTNVGFGFVTLYLVAIITSILITKVFNLEGDSNNQESIVSMFESNYDVFLIIVLVILAPFSEEIIFRKSFFNLFKKNTNPWIKIAISGFIFGFIHIGTTILGYIISGAELSLITNELIFGLSYIGQGIVLSYFYYRSDYNIFPVLTIHMINNIISVIAIY